MMKCCGTDASNNKDVTVSDATASNQNSNQKPQKKKMGLMRKQTVKNPKEENNSNRSCE